MSAAKFSYQPYKLFEPQYHTERPIIIDADAIESPETVTLRYEEEAAARTNGGCLRGDSPPGLLSKSYSKSQPPPMHAFESPRSYQDPQYQYSTSSFPAQSTENAATQLNHMAFAANNSTGQYMPSVGSSLTVRSCQPLSGGFATRVSVKISAPYDLLSVTSHFFLSFGSSKCAAHAVRDTHDTSCYSFIVSGDAPRFEDTRNSDGTVPLSVHIGADDTQPLDSISVGTFTYHDTTQVGTLSSPLGPHGDVTRSKISPSPEQRNGAAKQEADQLSDTATNTYDYSPVARHSTAPAYDATTYANNSDNMMGTYHRNTYATDYPRPAPPPLKIPMPWSPYPAPMRSPAMGHNSHTAVMQQNITSLPAPSHNSPQLLVRTSTLQSGPPGTAHYNAYAMATSKVTLKMQGHLDTVLLNWTKEEWDSRRRIVHFQKKQQNSTLTVSFRPVSVNERPPNSICISCIYWAEKRDFYVTSVDTISLLEQLLSAPTRFSVEEKNRIRRNLEGFRPLTVSKGKADSEEFFKIIMAFPNPKPRNIEKDVKVFPWKILEKALTKIINKYSAAPSSAVSVTPGPGALTPVSNTSPAHYAAPHVLSEAQYPLHGWTSSPRTSPVAPSPWSSYPGHSGQPLRHVRSMYGDLKSGAANGMHMPGVPSPISAGAYATGDTKANYGMPPQPQARWDTGAVTNGYMDAASVPAYTNHQHHGHVYGTGAYGDGGQRA